MAKLTGAEVWTTWAYGGGVRKALVVGLGDGESVRKVDGERRLTCTVARGNPEAAEGTAEKDLANVFAEILPGRVLRLNYDDSTWQEWWISEVNDASGSAEAQLVCLGLSGALDKCRPLALIDSEGRATFRFDAVGLTPASHFSDYILPAIAAGGLSFVEAGTFTPTGKLTLPYNGTKPWAAIRQLAAATGCEIDITRDDGTSKYKVHLVTQVGSGLTGPRLAYRENAAIIRTRSAIRQMNRGYGVAEDGATIGDGIWVISSKSGNDLGLADPAGGPGPVGFANQLNGLYLEAANQTTRVAISASTTAQVVTVSSAAAFTIGDRVRLRADSAGTRLLSLDDPASVAAYGILADTVLREDISSATNLIPNPEQSAWAGASSDPADGWAKVGTPTVTRTTTAAHRETGPYSARVQTTTDGHGYTSPSFPIRATSLEGLFSGYVNFKLVSGQVRVELVVTDGSSTWILPDGITQKAVTSETGFFRPRGVAGVPLLTYAPTSARIRVVQEGSGAAEFYVDAAQGTMTGNQRPLVVGSGPTALHQAVNAELAVRGGIGVRYEATAADFFRADAVTYPYAQFILGATHSIVDPSLGVVDGTRVLELGESLFSQLQTRVVLSSRPEDLSSIAARTVTTRLAPATLDFAGAGDARVLNDVDVSASSNGMYSPSAGFTTGDIGKALWVFGAGTDGAVLKTRITARSSVTNITMNNTAAISASGLTAIFGTADSVATLAAAIGGQRAGAAFVDEAGKLTNAVKDAASRPVDGMFAKVTSSDPDTFDGVADGSTFIKVIPFLTIRWEQTGVSPTSVTGNIIAEDPSGGADPTVSHNGGLAVTDNGGGSYTIAKAASGDGELAVLFGATKTGRVAQYCTVLVPEQAAGGGTVPPSIDFLVGTGKSNASNYLTLEWGVSNEPASETYDLRWRWKTTLADGTVTYEDQGTYTSITSPYNWSASSLDILDKGGTDWEYLEVSFQLRMRNSSSTLVASIDALIADYGKYVP
jgi:hypothetical protein